MNPNRATKTQTTILILADVMVWLTPTTELHIQMRYYQKQKLYICFTTTSNVQEKMDKIHPKKNRK